ncbi:hypothetical protein V6Z12_D11G134800 [Gossypium hirsutum]
MRNQRKKRKADLTMARPFLNWTFDEIGDEPKSDSIFLGNGDEISGVFFFLFSFYFLSFFAFFLTSNRFGRVQMQWRQKARNYLKFYGITPLILWSFWFLHALSAHSVRKSMI